jgi:hypothetical protein
MRMGRRERMRIERMEGTRTGGTEGIFGGYEIR